MGTNLVAPDKLKAIIPPIFLGISGALMGSTIGTGVGNSLPELLLALFLVIFASFFSMENMFYQGTEHFLILIAGAVAGLVIEYFTRSSIATVLAGGLVGISTVPVLSRIRAFRIAFRQATPYLYYAVWLIVLFAIFTPLYFWASSRGILKETLIAVAFLSSPVWVGYIVMKLQ